MRRTRRTPVIGYNLDRVGGRNIEFTAPISASSTGFKKYTYKIFQSSRLSDSVSPSRM